MSRRVFAIAAVALLIALGVGSAWLRPPQGELTVTWADSPACTYDASAQTVTVALSVTGSGSPVDVTVTAYADEDTAKPVGSVTETVSEDSSPSLTISVDREPFVDIDGVAACSISTSD